MKTLSFLVFFLTIASGTMAAPAHAVSFPAGKEGEE
jgi:hypothetical protein